MKTGMKGALCAVALVVLASACGEDSFAERDPSGYEACGDFAADQASGETTREVGGTFAVAEKARKASTKAIRDSASQNLLDEDAMDALEGTGSEGVNFPLLDVDAFKAACTDAGFQFD